MGREDEPKSVRDAAKRYRDRKIENAKARTFSGGVLLIGGIAIMLAGLIIATSEPYSGGSIALWGAKIAGAKIAKSGAIVTLTGIGAHIWGKNEQRSLEDSDHTR